MSSSMPNACPDDQMILDVGPKIDRALPAGSGRLRHAWSGTGRSAPSKSRRSTPAPMALAQDRGATSPSPGQAVVGGGRRRHRGGAGRGGRGGEVLLHFDGWRRFPRMDGRQDPARRCSPDPGGLRVGGMSAPTTPPERPRLPWDPPEHFEKRVPGRRQPGTPGLRPLRVHPLPEPQGRRRARFAPGATGSSWPSAPSSRARASGHCRLATWNWARPPSRPPSVKPWRRPAPPSRSTGCSPCTAWRASARCRSCIAPGWSAPDIAGRRRERGSGFGRMGRHPLGTARLPDGRLGARPLPRVARQGRLLDLLQSRRATSPACGRRGSPREFELLLPHSDGEVYATEGNEERSFFDAPGHCKQCPAAPWPSSARPQLPRAKGL